MMKENHSHLFQDVSFEGFTDYTTARAIATSAGDLSTVVRREVKKVLEKHRNNIPEALNSGLEELLTRKLISEEESDSLKHIFKHLFYAIRGKESGEEAFFAIRNIYHDMLVEQQASPAALAIASVVTSVFDLEKGQPFAAPAETSGTGESSETVRGLVITITPGTTAAGAAAGALLGSLVGCAIGGVMGAGIGAAIGGAAGAVIGWCNETDDGNKRDIHPGGQENLSTA